MQDLLLDLFSSEAFASVFQFVAAAETQAAILIGLSFLGFWVFLSYLLQLIRTLVWLTPFVTVIFILMAVPSVVREALVNEILPKQYEAVLQLIGRT